VSETGAAASFLGRPLGREGEAAWLAANADMLARLVPAKPVLFLLSQHWFSSAIIAVRFFIALKPYAVISLASRASVYSSK
jgi:hypothetical protein